jgi:hypothetical protein
LLWIDLARGQGVSRTVAFKLLRRDKGVRG